MRIEKINDHQIRCTLNQKDLSDRELRISELAYGSEKAKALFRDMMQQASYEFGFEAEDIPLMVEAIPMYPDSLVLVITKVDDPDELDTRFSHFTDDDSDFENGDDDDNMFTLDDDMSGLDLFDSDILMEPEPAADAVSALPQNPSGSSSDGDFRSTWYGTPSKDQRLHRKSRCDQNLLFPEPFRSHKSGRVSHLYLPRFQYRIQGREVRTVLSDRPQIRAQPGGV